MEWFTFLTNGKSDFRFPDASPFSLAVAIGVSGEAERGTELHEGTDG
jgi:hypothetical protein